MGYYIYFLFIIPFLDYTAPSSNIDHAKLITQKSKSFFKSQNKEHIKNERDYPVQRNYTDYNAYNISTNCSRIKIFIIKKFEPFNLLRRCQWKISYSFNNVTTYITNKKDILCGYHEFEPEIHGIEYVLETYIKTIVYRVYMKHTMQFGVQCNYNINITAVSHNFVQVQYMNKTLEDIKCSIKELENNVTYHIDQLEYYTCENKLLNNLKPNQLYTIILDMDKRIYCDTRHTLIYTKLNIKIKFSNVTTTSAYFDPICVPTLSQPITNCTIYYKNLKHDYVIKVTDFDCNMIFIENLIPNTEYNFTLECRNYFYSGTFRTKINYSIAITFNNITCDSINICNQILIDKNIITGYECSHYISHNFDIFNLILKTMCYKMKTCYILKDLYPSTHYVYKIHPSAIVANNNYSTEFRTRSKQIDSITIAKISYTQIWITLNTKHNNLFCVFGISSIRIDQEMKLGSNNCSNYRFDDLFPGTKYLIKVYVNNDTCTEYSVKNVETWNIYRELEIKNSNNNCYVLSYTFKYESIDDNCTFEFVETNNYSIFLSIHNKCTSFEVCTLESGNRYDIVAKSRFSKNSTVMLFYTALEKAVLNIKIIQKNDAIFVRWTKSSEYKYSTSSITLLYYIDTNSKKISSNDTIIAYYITRENLTDAKFQFKMFQSSIKIIMCAGDTLLLNLLREKVNTTELDCLTRIINLNIAPIFNPNAVVLDTIQRKIIVINPVTNIFNLPMLHNYTIYSQSCLWKNTCVKSMKKNFSEKLHNENNWIKIYQTYLSDISEKNNMNVEISFFNIYNIISIYENIFVISVCTAKKCTFSPYYHIKKEYVNVLKSSSFRMSFLCCIVVFMFILFQINTYRIIIRERDNVYLIYINNISKLRNINIHQLLVLKYKRRKNFRIQKYIYCFFLECEIVKQRVYFFLYQLMSTLYISTFTILLFPITFTKLVYYQWKKMLLNKYMIYERAQYVCERSNELVDTIIVKLIESLRTSYAQLSSENISFTQLCAYSKKVIKDKIKPLLQKDATPLMRVYPSIECFNYMRHNSEFNYFMMIMPSILRLKTDFKSIIMKRTKYNWKVSLIDDIKLLREVNYTTNIKKFVHINSFDAKIKFFDAIYAPVFYKGETLIISKSPDTNNIKDFLLLLISNNINFIFVISKENVKINDFQKIFLHCLPEIVTNIGQVQILRKDIYNHADITLTKYTIKYKQLTKTVHQLYFSKFAINDEYSKYYSMSRLIQLRHSSIDICKSVYRGNVLVHSPDDTQIAPLFMCFHVHMSRWENERLSIITYGYYLKLSKIRSGLIVDFAYYEFLHELLNEALNQARFKYLR